MSKTRIDLIAEAVLVEPQDVTTEGLKEIAHAYLMMREKSTTDWGPSLPTGSLENGRAMVVQYVRPDGKMGISVGTKGDLPISSFVGLLHLGAFDLMHQDRHMNPPPGENDGR